MVTLAHSPRGLDRWPARASDADPRDQRIRTRPRIWPARFTMRASRRALGPARALRVLPPAPAELGRNHLESASVRFTRLPLLAATNTGTKRPPDARARSSATVSGTSMSFPGVSVSRLAGGWWPRLPCPPSHRRRGTDSNHREPENAPNGFRDRSVARTQAVGVGCPPGLQNRQGGATLRLDGSIPSPLRGEKPCTAPLCPPRSWRGLPNRGDARDRGKGAMQRVSTIARPSHCPPASPAAGRG
jgi:hypothetical protein